MATSGTIGKTKLNTSRLVDKALRRCGINPVQQTPEIVEQALEDLFMLIMSLSNRGLNLWCVEKYLFPLTAFQARYPLPAGTQALLNVIHSLHTNQEPVTIAPGAQDYIYDFGADTPVRPVRFGVQFGNIVPANEVFFWYSNDDITYFPLVTEDYGSPKPEDYVPGTTYWFDVKVINTFRYIKIERPPPDPLFVDKLIATIRSSEIQVTQFNRDDYSAQPTKTMTSGRPTNFYFEKLVEPTITIWPIPDTDKDCLTIYRYRQIQDIGDLQNEIEIPVRWLEAITWHLALRLAYEIPGADARIQACQQMAQSMVIEVEGDETDAAPTYFQPNIRVYTR